jgi:hypothetical protein
MQFSLLESNYPIVYTSVHPDQVVFEFEVGLKNAPYNWSVQYTLKYLLSLTLLSTRKIRKLMNNVNGKNLEQVNINRHLKKILLLK